MTHHAVFSGYYYDKQLRGVYSDQAAALRVAGTYPLAFRSAYCPAQPIWLECIHSPLGK